ncbi:MAG: oxidoreductase [Planctomycetota bacterium]|nr:oxidoreductase [Planctomycetota bacterium]
MHAGQVWFITGASSGFGRAFAEHALSRGYAVVIGARNLDKLKEIERIDPVRVLAVRLDVNKHDEVRHATAAAIERFGRVDVLFNNAGYGIVGAVEETPMAELRAQLETNFFGAVSITREFLPHFRARRSGAIVNISSLGGQLSYAGFGAYSASKFALEGLSEALAQEMKPFGVKVLIVEPGAFRTSFAGDAMKHMPSIDAYRDVVGGTRQFARSMHNAQEGDPRKAAAAVEHALQSSETPLRLALGTDAVSSIRGHSETLLRDLATWEAVSLDTKLDDRA